MPLGLLRPIWALASVFLAIQIQYATSYSLVCHQGCPLIHPNDIIWLRGRPCYHPGQPILPYPVGSSQDQSDTLKDCFLTSTVVDSFRSEQVSLQDGMIFAKQRICFYDSIQTVNYTYICNGISKSSKFRLGHSVFSKPHRRTKRWVRRRNPVTDIIHFQQERYVSELLENVSVGSLVASVRASHATDQPIYYSMSAPQDSRSQNMFSLDTVTGDVKVAKSLDRETLDRHVLKVTAYERVDPTVYSSTTVIVDVLDVQDNSPIFERDSYFADIKEDVPIGTTILSVFARDLDIGENGEIVYSLSEGEGSEFIAINSKSGVIQTAAQLDRETIAMIRLDVIATDAGTPPRSTSAVVEIGIQDINDNAPVFEQESYNVSISENVNVPLVLGSVKAHDKDIGLNGKVHYSIVSTPGVPLTIGYSSGEVTLRERIDARQSPLTVMIRAKDGAQPALTSTTSFTLYISDENDHAPRFIAAQKHIFIEENVAVGEEVSKVYAIDDDSDINGRVRYSMVGSTDFGIDPETGVIRTTKSLDRETTAEYHLVITASDHGTPVQNTSTTMIVEVKDVNDNTPLFEHDVYNITLSEDTQRGTQIMMLKAHDKDENQKISYRIEHADREIVSLLDMGEQGAILTLSGRLQTTDDLIRIEVSASDQGGLQSHAVVNLLVEDINSAPYFVEHPFSVHVPEDSPEGFPVITMRAIDEDRGANAEVKYWLVSGDDGDFRIDTHNGQVTVVSGLDRESRASYTLVIGAADGATEPMNVTTQLEVIVDDVNDHQPKFTSDKYETSISEDIPVGTSFMQVAALDEDSGANGVVDFFLNDSDPTVALDLFRLDRTSGTLRVNQKLDRETHKSLILPVIARDRGKPPLSSESSIHIHLLDVNDNAPQFHQKEYDLYIAENSPVGSLVGTISATDPDEGENSVMEFRIFGGADAKLFDIEADELHPGIVRILTRNEFDYEAKANKFFVEVQASSGQLSTTVPVRVHVSDVNDNRPILKDFIVLVTKYEDEVIANEIGTVPAFDPDQNATLEYFLEENELLTIDKPSGRLHLKQQWKQSIDLTLKTCVTDGPNTVCSSLRFLHIHVNEAIISEAVEVSIFGISVDDFWDPNVFARFRQSLAILGTWDTASILILGAKKTDYGINVNFAVVEKGRVVRSWKVEEVLKSGVKSLERNSLMRITVNEDSSCANEPCPYYQQCRQTLKYINNMESHQTDNFIVRSLKTLRTFSCECPTGFTSSIDLPNQCDVRLDQCYSNPCRNDGLCHSLEQGYRCECKPGWRGKLCEQPMHSLTCVPGYCKSGASCLLLNSKMVCKHCPHAKEDTDEQCRLRSLRFKSNGILNLNHQLTRIQWSLSLRVSTISQDGVLLFTGRPDSDHLELSIRDRLLHLQYSLGGKNKTMKMDSDMSNRVNDGRWHTVKLDFYDRRIVLSLDECDPFTALNAYGSVPCAVQTKIELSAKCLDPTVPCHRFLDVSNGFFIGGRPAANQQVHSGFDGCMSDFHLNNELLDFSSLSEFDYTGQIEEGCNPMKNKCEASGCNGRCIEKWNGMNCRCDHSIQMNGSCRASSASSRPISLYDDESFVTFAPDTTTVPFGLSLEFRTSRPDTQVIVAEFDNRNIFYRLEIDDGLFRVSIGPMTEVISAPEFEAGQWSRVDVAFNEEEVVTTIDGLYSITLRTSLFDMQLDSVYTGLAPSTGHPSRFEGCLRGVEIDGQEMNIKEKGKVRNGCVVQNRCSLHGVCPKEAKCLRGWDRHKCSCHKGFVGDTCMPVCSLKGICGSDGYCQVTNSSHGYECQCTSGLSGRNCDRVAAQQICPAGWWGKYSNCRKCACETDKGLLEQCDANTGECKCQKFHFFSPLSSSCVSCECGFGASSLQCSSDGQCNCSGDAVGRRCDRCRLDNQVLEPKSQKCIGVRDRCPSQIEEGIQWPTTAKGVISRSSCKGTESGLATRECSSQGKWEAVKSYNCTKQEYAIMVNKFDALDSMELLSLLQNATHRDRIIRGRNLEIARSAAERIINNQLRISPKARQHMRDTTFTETLAISTAQMLSNEEPRHYLKLVRSLSDYGKAVLEVHERAKFLEPFAVITENALFSVDRLDFSNHLPKFNNFLDTRLARKESTVGLTITGAQLVFYSILSKPRCLSCDSPVVLFHANTTHPILVEFSLTEENGWKYPECVMLHSKHVDWSTTDATLIGLNLSHATCQFSRSGVYTLLVKSDKSHFIRLSHSPSLSSPVLAIVALLLCGASFIATLARRGIRTQLVRLGFILTFAISLANMYSIHRIAVNVVFCPVRNALVTFSTIAPFAWQFLYSLHMYRMIADENTNSSCTICLLIGLILPCLISCVSFVYATQCSIQPQGWLFWILIMPIGLFLLLSFYSSATCLLISLNKQYDVYVVKFNLRKALVQHLVLTLVTLAATVVGLFLPIVVGPSPMQELITNVVLVVAALAILIWSVCPSLGPSQKSTSLWVDGGRHEMSQSMLDAAAVQSPLLERNDDWLPELIPSDPYLTSTPKKSQMRDYGEISREYQMDRRDSRDNPVANSILSPADKILNEGLGHVYGNMGTLPRFKSNQDDTEDAYYTYTTSRRQRAGTTFNR